MSFANYRDRESESFYKEQQLPVPLNKFQTVRLDKIRSNSFEKCRHNGFQYFRTFIFREYRHEGMALQTADKFSLVASRSAISSLSENKRLELLRAVKREK